MSQEELFIITLEEFVKMLQIAKEEEKNIDELIASLQKTIKIIKSAQNTKEKD